MRQLPLQIYRTLYYVVNVSIALRCYIYIHLLYSLQLAYMSISSSAFLDNSLPTEDQLHCRSFQPVLCPHHVIIL